MSGPCFAHFQMNCQICFPTATNGNSTKTSQPAPTAVPATASTTPGGGGDAATPANSTVGTVVATVESSSPDTPTEASSTAVTEKKRKRINVEFRPLKRKKNAIIDCVIAQQIFRRDFRLTNKFFKSGNVLAWALEPDDPAFRYIHDYVAVGQEHGFGLKVCSILRIVAKAKSLEDTQVDFNHDPDTKDKLRMMLWHGTKKGVITSILENGLMLPRGVGQMFGPGIYFADRISKCCNYCGVYYGKGKAYFLLCDVLLGNVFESIHAMNRLMSPPPTILDNGPPQRTIQNDSVKGLGRKFPDVRGNKVHDGSVWPLGETVQHPDGGDWRDRRYRLPLNFNEYIVYKENQVQPKYLVKVQFTEKLHYEN